MKVSPQPWIQSRYDYLSRQRWEWCYGCMVSLRVRYWVLCWGREWELNWWMKLLRGIGWGGSDMFYGKVMVIGWEACCTRWMVWEAEESLGWHGIRWWRKIWVWNEIRLMRKIEKNGEDWSGNPLPKSLIRGENGCKKVAVVWIIIIIKHLICWY